MKVVKNESSQLQNKLQFKTSEENQNGLMTRQRANCPVCVIKFSSEINSGSTTLTKCIKHKSNVKIAAQMLAKRFRVVLIKKLIVDVPNRRFQLHDDVQPLTSPRKAAITAIPEPSGKLSKNTTSQETTTSGLQAYRQVSFLPCGRAFEAFLEAIV